MKTIAISIDETTLEALDRFVEPTQLKGKRALRGAGNRSKVVRLALQEFIARHEKVVREARERRILAANRKRLDREAAALVAEQAKL